MNRLPAYQVQRLYRAFDGGASVRRAALLVGCSKDTACRYRHRYKHTHGFGAVLRALHKTKRLDGPGWTALQVVFAKRFAAKTANIPHTGFDWWIKYFFKMSLPE